jgi:hypothetical protein
MAHAGGCNPEVVAADERPIGPQGAGDAGIAQRRLVVDREQQRGAGITPEEGVGSARGIG